VDAATILAIFAAGLFYYGNLYLQNEKKFSFYQAYFISALNIYCINDPNVRAYNSLSHNTNDRIDISKISCSEIEKSPILNDSYYNGWHDTHPILSTLIGHTWRLFGFSWEALWPIAGTLGALTIVSFYVALRCFGTPWLAATLLFPALIPNAFFEQNFYYLRDFSKVPFILLAFALLGLLFRPQTTYRGRLLTLVVSTATIAIGTGFRQDTIVLLPVILGAAVIAECSLDWKAVQRLAISFTAIAGTFILLTLAIGLLKTSQTAQLQGYPHFIVQGFADVFWKDARSGVPGVSFLALYSDVLAWAAVDANSTEHVKYFGTLDPKYTTSGFDLIVKYWSLSAADTVTRIFGALSTISHGYWIVDRIATWLVWLLCLVAIGQWRLSYFLAFSLFSLTAAGSIQFSPRHSIHLIMLDRTVVVIVATTLLATLWRYIMSSRWTLDLRLTAWSGIASVLLVGVVVVGTHFVQSASVARLKHNLETLHWQPSKAMQAGPISGTSEALVRFTIDPSRCPGVPLEAIMELEGETVTRRLDSLDGKPRSVYFAVFEPTVEKVTVDVKPHICVIERSLGRLGDGSTPPLQFFDPAAALAAQHLGRHFLNILSAIR
jgi:hypothetical protein